MKTPVKLTLLYIGFAIIATVCNLAAQDITIQVYSGPFYLAASILIGTAAGLVVKYVLDKKYIFQFYTTDVNQDAKVFFMYCSMGVFTTVIFWATEFGFHYAFETKAMRYVGACIGLSIGYFIKYTLDKKFVFKKSHDSKNPIMGEPVR